MRVLAIDTSTPRGSVACAEDGVVLVEVRRVARDSHSTWVLSAIEFVLEQLGLDGHRMDGFAVTVGPGSFTGVRIGISTIQGIALAAGRPCIGVTTLEVLAAAVQHCGAARLVPLVDAYRHEVFGAVYDSHLRAIEPMAAKPVASFLKQLSTAAAFVGDGAEKYESQILVQCADARFPQREPFLAGTLARLACQRLAMGQSTAPGALRAVYLREADLRKKDP